jgi:ubiquinone/menaquinone biosynthesis C-methylase UbiE
MDSIFYEIFSNLPRQGPGDVMLTLECFQKVCDLNKPLKILDAGCGTGFQTIFLALQSNFEITALDNHQPYLDEIDLKAKAAGIGHRIKTVNGDMACMNFNDNQFDIILSEGAMYIFGIENGLKEWKKFLKTDGVIIFSEIGWLKTPPKGELTDFWEKEYPGMSSMENLRSLIAKCNYELVYEQILPSTGWVNNYYYPLELNVINARQKYKSNTAALEIVESIQQEIDLFYKYCDYFSYSFFVCRKKN